jgi:hypothetical protein
MATALNYEISTTLLAERRISICRIRSTQDSGTSTPNSKDNCNTFTRETTNH